MLTPQNFRAAVGDAGVTLRYIDVDLTNAKTDEQLHIAGSFFFIPNVAFDSQAVKSSSLTVGHAFLRLGKRSADHVYVGGNYVYENEPFDEIFITSPAQANKMLRIYYSHGPSLRPYSSDTTISGAVSVYGESGAGDPVLVDLYGSPLGASRADVNSAGAGSLTLVAPGTNTGGLILRTAGALPSSTWGSLLADTVPPTDPGDGHNILTVRTGGSSLPYPLLIQAGLGIYQYASAAQMRSIISYDLL